MIDKDPNAAVTHRISIVRVPRHGQLYERLATAAIYVGASIACLAFIALVTLTTIWIMS